MEATKIRVPCSREDSEEAEWYVFVIDNFS